MKTQRALAVLILAFAGGAVPALWADTPAEVAIVVTGDHIDFLAGKSLVTRYHKGDHVAKPYCWPVFASGDVPLTRGWPMEAKKEGGTTDHVHQKSLWFCHGDVIPEGVELKQKIKGVDGVDFWSEAKGHGTIVPTKVGTPHSANGHGALATHNEWQTGDGTKIMDEQRDIHVYDLGKARL